MGNLIKAEFRKVFTTKVWWALLIPAVVVAFGWAYIFARIGTGVGDSVQSDPTFQQLGLNSVVLPWSVLAMSRAINIASIFPMLFGALAVSSELSRRTITTSFLTAPSRATMLSAKAVTYALCGIGYGVVIGAVAWLGTLAGSDSQYLPNAGGFLTLIGTGIVATALWTLLGLGVGALFGSPVGTIITLVMYTVVAEPVLDLFLHNHFAGSLPNGSADGLVGSTAAQILVDKAQSYQSIPVIQQAGQNAWNDLILGFRVVADAIGAFSWWASGLIFLGWTLVFFLAGTFITQRRDIT